MANSSIIQITQGNGKYLSQKDYLSRDWHIPGSQLMLAAKSDAPILGWKKVFTKIF